MHIVVIAWIYVALMMSISELSVIAGIMTFLLYGVFPLSIILYISGTGRRKRERAAAEKMRRNPADSATEPDTEQSLATPETQDKVDPDLPADPPPGPT